MTDVIFFDYWTRGVRHFATIDKRLKQLGYSTRLVHMGSTRKEPTDERCYVDNISCHDISYYNGSLITMLKKERPKVVLLLNNQTEDKIIVRACRALNIKTIFLMHGALSMPGVLEVNAKITDSAFGLVARLSRVIKYCKLYIQYMQAAKLNHMFSLLDYEIPLYLVRLAYSPGKTVMSYWKYKDSCANIALVYTENDKELFIKKVGYRSEQVKKIGNYNLDELFIKSQTMAHSNDIENKTSPYVVYIENGLSNQTYQVKGWTETLVASEVKQLSNIFEQRGYRFKLKLHPSSNYSELISALKDEKNIEIIYHCDLAELIIHSSLVLGQSSTVLMMALAIHKPILLLSIPPLTLQLLTYHANEFGRLVTSFEQVNAIVDDGTAFIPNYIETNREGVSRFIGSFDGLAGARILDEVLSCLSFHSDCNRPLVQETCLLRE